MNYNIFFSLLLIIFAACGSKNKTDAKPENKEVGSGETGNYKLVWEDLFADGSLNKNNWTIEVNGDGGGNNELQYYKEENISLGKEPATGKSCLIITAKKEQYLGKSATSGRLITKGKKFFKYGKIEASIKLPKTANGLWPAFWMMGNDHSTVGWPKCGEIDILEMGNANGIKNGTQDKYFNGACHWGPDWNGGAYPNYAKATTLNYGIQDDFHLFTVIWDENAIKMYLDLDKNPNAQPYFEMAITDKANVNSPGLYFHKDNFILLNLAVGGHFTGILNINQITALNNGPANMYVDFVKVYQKTN
ncbi:family 16 glycosylhydrolase [Pedobacter sp. ASV28]|uniref:glycoside hydrolase family 16 protein n=1 Tax=Pedobacter sp. ASV28 TaxID=2795123 RepID=UPI001E53FFA5|nr:glycoside hydrolase family 16 protein [Pedobacter sp. ASV28]